MKTIPSTVCARLEVRGVTVDEGDPDFARIVPWTRTTFILCGAITATGVALAFTPLLIALMPIAALGVLLPIHPFDLVYNLGIRRITGTGPLPRNAAPTRFACGVAVVWLGATVLAFEAGPAWLGYVLGGLLVSVLTGNAAMLRGTLGSPKA